MKGVILATGLGQYLVPLSTCLPHPSAFVPERPLIDYAIEAFMNAGFEEIGIVLGYNEGILRPYLQDSARYGIAIYCLHNPWHMRGSATSLFAARPFVEGEPFVVAMADRLLPAHLLFPLLVSPWHAHVMCVNRRNKTGARWQGTVKVWLDKHGKVQRIGKRLKHWHAVDTGVFLFQSRIFHHLSYLLRRWEEPCSVIQLAQHLIASGDELWACDVSNSFLLDNADNWNHFRYVQQMLSIRLAQEELIA
nr:hypothetical protein [Chloroflexota bacterium]